METTIEYQVAPAEYRVASGAVILGLDCSSTTIGWCVLDGPTVRDYGEIVLKHSDVNERCRLARAGVGLVLLNHPDIDAAAIEAPASRFKKSLIPQCFVSGAVRSLLSEKGILICDVAPQHAKAKLSGHGDALKEEMQRAALCYGVIGEHAADALGVGLVGLGRVEVTR